MDLAERAARPVAGTEPITHDGDRTVLEVRERDGVLFLSGELDANGAAEFRRIVADEIEGKREIVLDLAELDFIDSNGARTIASLAHRLDGCSLVIRYPKDAVVRVWELLEMDELPGIRIQD